MGCSKNEKGMEDKVRISVFSSRAGMSSPSPGILRQGQVGQ